MYVKQYWMNMLNNPLSLYLSLSLSLSLSLNPYLDSYNYKQLQIKELSNILSKITSMGKHFNIYVL